MAYSNRHTDKKKHLKTVATKFRLKSKPLQNQVADLDLVQEARNILYICGIM